MTGHVYQSEFLGSLHDTAEGLHTIGVITDTEMRDYDRNCLVRQSKAACTGAAPRSQSVIPAYAGERK